MSTTSTQIPSVMFDQMQIVQNIGSVNMLDMSGIIRIAHTKGLYELVLFLTDIKISQNASTKYMDFLQAFGESLKN